MKLEDYLINKTWDRAFTVISYERHNYYGIRVCTENTDNVKHYYKLENLIYQIKCNDIEFYNKIVKEFPEVFI